MDASRPSFPSPKPPDPAGVSPPPLSYASVAAAIPPRPSLRPRFTPLELPARQVGLKEGRPSISFSGAEVGACEKRFEHSIIAKFTAGRPRLAEIQKAFQSSWATTGRVSMSEVWDSRHVLLIFDSEEDVRVALASPLNKVGHALFRLFRWHPEYNPKRESTITTVWIKLPGLPISIYDSAFIEAIVSTFGYYVSVDERTKACTALNYARACVELDVTKAIPDAVWVNLPDNKSYWQSIEVDSKIAFCNKCKIHGHTFDCCRKRKGKQVLGGDVDTRSDPVVIPQKDKDVIPESSREAGEAKEWRKVLSNKGKKASRKAPENSQCQERTAEANVTSKEADPDAELKESDGERAIVVYGSNSGNRNCTRTQVSQGNNKSRKVAFANFIPKDLSGAELKLRNKSSNVLIFNEDLGVYAHPEHLPYYMNIQKKAGSTRPGKDKVDREEAVKEGNVAIKDGCLSGSKHCPSSVSS